jgi:glutamine synthetase
MLNKPDTRAGSSGGAVVNPSPEVQDFLRRFPLIRYIDAIFIDMCGIARGKRLPADQLAGLYSHGLYLPASIFALDVTGDQLDVLGRGFSDGDPDGCGFPIPGTLAPAPWSGAELGQVLMSLHEPAAQQFCYDPRNVLAAVVGRFGDIGLTPVVACELEFYLLDAERAAGGEPRPPLLPGLNRRDYNNQVYSLEELDYYQEFMRDLQQWSAAQNIPATFASAEFGPAQFEINLLHRPDALRAADDAALLRRLVKGAAQARGLQATFMSKPYADKVGSGLHLHISLLNEAGENVFNSNGAKGSEVLLHAIGGVCRAMQESMAIFAPSQSAFRRFAPNLFVPVSDCWGYNNRSVAVRVPPGSDSARRLEHRVSGADANPYLVVAAVLAGMHYGIVTKAEPGEPIEGNAGAKLTPDLALNMWAALADLAEGEILPAYFPGNYLALYIDGKRRELEKFLRTISPLEYEWYL